MLPHLVQIGPFTLYSFGLLVILGFGAGLWLATRLAQRRGLPGDAFLDAAVIILFAGVAGARLLFVALNWKTYSAQLWQVAALWQGGMSYHGGVIASIIAGALVMRRNRLPVLLMADAAAPGIALGYAIGRIGCLLNGCCYGGPTNLPWGIHFPDSPPGVHSHPAQIYATVINLGLCAALATVYRRAHRPGQVMALYVAGYSVYRFFIESLRLGATAELFAFGLTKSQIFSLVTLVLVAGWWLWLNQRSAPVPALGPDEPETAVEAIPGT